MTEAKKRPNGEGYFRKRKDGRYERQITIKIDGKCQRRSVYGRTLRDLHKKTDDLRRLLGTGWLPGNSDMRVTDLADRWLRGVLDASRKGERSIRTYEQYEWLARSYILPELAGLAISRVTEACCKRVLAGVSDLGRADQTRAHVYARLHGMLQFALDEGWLAEHPMKRMKRPVVRPYNAYVLSQEQAVRFLAAASNEPDFNAALATALTLGMRPSEVLGLRQSALNNRGKIEVRAELQRLPRALRPTPEHDGFVIVERAKWGSERAPVLSPVAERRLRAQIARQAERRLAAGSTWAETVTVMREGRYGDFAETKNDLLFTRADGRPLDLTLIRRAFIRVCTAAGIPWSAREQRGLRLHDLRGSASTLLIEGGESARAVMALLGHKSPQMFLHYTKVEEQARAQTAARMDRILGAS